MDFANVVVEELLRFPLSLRLSVPPVGQNL
jgi:hypothetical protein